MGIFEGIEKLITEHGSAAILKERISLVKEQYAVLEKKLSDSEDRLKELESEKTRFELENYKLKEKITLLEKQIFAAHDTTVLEELKEKILIIISQHEIITEEFLVRTLRIGKQLATFHLEGLQESGFIDCSYTVGTCWSGEGGRTEWYLLQTGRSYLFNRGLLQ